MVFRGFLSIPRILTELRSEKFEWFGPSPIEPFNSGLAPPAGPGSARSQNSARSVTFSDVEATPFKEGSSSGSEHWEPSVGRPSVESPDNLTDLAVLLGMEESPPQAAPAPAAAQPAGPAAVEILDAIDHLAASSSSAETSTESSTAEDSDTAAVELP